MKTTYLFTILLFIVFAVPAVAESIFMKDGSIVEGTIDNETDKTIIIKLTDGKKKTVTEIHKQLGIEQSTASHHLGILKDKGVLSSKREGKNTWYFLKHENLKTVLNCVSVCCQE